MAKKINKTELINCLKETQNLEENDCRIILDIFDHYFFFDKNKKDSIIEDIVKNLQVSNEKATSIYEETMNTISLEIKNKLKHPFN